MAENVDVRRNEKFKNEKIIHKSTVSDEFTLIKFINRTRRLVNIFWHDFDGNLVRYLAVMPPTVNELDDSDFRCIDTFVSHPWSAKDAVTGQSLLLNGSTIFYGTAWNGEEERHDVYIDLPVYSLHEMCLHVVRQLYDPEQLDSEIPRLILQEMTTNTRDDYTDYIPQNT